MAALQRRPSSRPCAAASLGIPARVTTQSSRRRSGDIAEQAVVPRGADGRRERLPRGTGGHTRRCNILLYFIYIYILCDLHRNERVTRPRNPDGGSDEFDAAVS